MFIKELNTMMIFVFLTLGILMSGCASNDMKHMDDNMGKGTDKMMDSMEKSEMDSMHKTMKDSMQ